MSASSKLELVLEAIDRASGPLSKIERHIDRLERASGQSSRAMSGLGQRGTVALNGIATAGMAAAGAVALIGKNVVSAAADFEQGLSQIQKKAGTTVEQTRAIGEKIKALGTSGKVASSFAELQAAYDAAGGAGIPLDQIEQYALLTAKGADAFEMSNAAMGEFMGNLRFGMNQTTPQIMKTLDVINALADSGKAAESDIAKFVGNTGAQLKGMGFADGQVAALGATFLNMGVQQDVAATATSALATKLATVGTLGGKSRKTFEKFMGPLGKFSKLVAKDADGAFVQMLDRMSKMSAADRAEFGLSFVGLEHVDTLGRLVTASDDLKRNFQLAGDESKWLGSLDKSYELKLGTFWAQWQVFKNQVDKLSINVGTAGMPMFKDALVEAQGIVADIDRNLQSFGSMIDKDGLKQAIGSLGQAKSAVESLLNINTSGSQVDIFFRDLASAVDGISGAVNATADAIERVRAVLPGQSAEELASPSRPADRVYDLGLGQKMTIGEGGLADRFLDMWERNYDRMTGQTPRLNYDPAFRPWYMQDTASAQAVPDITGQLGEQEALAVPKAVEIGQQIEAATSVTGAPKIDTTSIDAATEKVRALSNALSGVPGSITVADPSAKALPSVPIDGARAAGGPVSAGGLYLVGEEGPELFSPGASGSIDTHARTKRLFENVGSGRGSEGGAGGSGGGAIDASMQVHIGSMSFADPKDKAEFEDLLRKHARTVADVVNGEARRASRLNF